MEVAIVIVALIAFAGFRQWLQHDRRLMVHRERLAALEKGAELPPLEQEIQRGKWNVQRILLLAGLVWISVGVGLYVCMSAILAYKPADANVPFPPGLQYVAVGPIAIGISHLIVYFIGKHKESSGN
ncbi:MAG TPA: hypothetical protein VLY23_08765 [Candidatus Acidoferrum sp.]|nr:hypothetical protein [Candidatus Acidoferrum sp.]